MRINKKPKLFLLIFAAILSTAFVYYFSLREVDKYDSTSLSKRDFVVSLKYCNVSNEVLQNKYSQTISKIFDRYWNGNEESIELLELNEAINAKQVYCAYRKDGLKIFETITKGNSFSDALVRNIQQAFEKINPDKIPSINFVEISTIYSVQKIDLDNRRDKRRFNSNIHRGVLGLLKKYDNKEYIYPPTSAISTNRSFKRIRELFAENNGINEEEFNGSVDASLFNSHQFFVALSRQTKSIVMERGNTFVPVEDITRNSTAQLTNLAAEWLVNNVHDDGRMTYKYFPSRGTESNSNNMIRQWMASVALNEIAKQTGSDSIYAIAKRNIQYNLDNFYRTDNGFGLIEYNEKVKLGSLALAALAIITHPSRSEWQDIEQALLSTINHLWNKNGSFRTFYKPMGRNDNQNFYPGETLLLWAKLYEESHESELLNRFIKSFEYYKAWHLDKSNRNPAFIPWHTQAYYIIWQITRNEQLKQFIFKMNDWLLDMQQWGDNLQYCDIGGRFYNPRRPYGPPHSSATGVYLEGLIDAYNLALETGDKERAENCRKVIVRGIRSVAQLQFQDEVDMFYVSKKKRNYVKGGIRTTVYDNQIRCDNVQHNLLALYKILNSFNEDDYNVE